MLKWAKDNALGLLSLAAASASGIGSWISGLADAVRGHEWQLLLAALAVFLLGYSAGWFIRGGHDVRREDRRESEVIRRRIESLDPERRHLLDSTYVYGIARVDWESRENSLMEGMAAMGLVEGGGGIVITWQLTARCRRVMEEKDRR